MYMDNENNMVAFLKTTQAKQWRCQVQTQHVNDNQRPRMTI
jgi:hypothetical protein